MSGLGYTTTYYWHVRAVNALGGIYSNGSSSAIWSFTTAAPTPVMLADFKAVSTPQGIQLRWLSGEEIDLLGFNLFRAETSDGQQVQVNFELISAINPGQLQGNKYQYVDKTTETGKTYYYWVEWVGNRSTEFYGPVTASLAPFWVWLPVGLK